MEHIKARLFQQILKSNAHNHHTWRYRSKLQWFHVTGPLSFRVQSSRGLHQFCGDLFLTPQRRNVTHQMQHGSPLVRDSRVLARHPQRVDGGGVVSPQRRPAAQRVEAAHLAAHHAHVGSAQGYRTRLRGQVVTRQRRRFRWSIVNLFYND